MQICKRTQLLAHRCNAQQALRLLLSPPCLNTRLALCLASRINDKMHRVLLILSTVCAAAQAWSIKERGAGIDSVETTFQTRLKGGGKGVTLTYVLAACGDEVGELEEDVREDEGAKYLDATELHAAAFGGRADCCEKLVARGDAVDARLNTTNWTPMHVAAQGGNAAVVEYLLGQGADPNAAGVDPTPDRPPNQVGPAPDGFTALHAAVRAGSCVEINQCVGALMAWRTMRRFSTNAP